MRNRILTMLRAHIGEYYSGEQISKCLAISRTAVWKHIQVLKQEGYEIDSHHKQGYSLRQLPDLLKPEEIKAELSQSEIGNTIVYLDTIDSTNKKAKQLAIEGCPHGTVVISEEQQGGKGRLARGWFSPKNKGVWMSVVLRPSLAPAEAPKCTLMAAVAINNAIEKTCGIRCGIKWPNDILYGGKKLVGILTEVSADMDGINYLVIGIGINVNVWQDEFPDELQNLATSLAAIHGKFVSRIVLAANMLDELNKYYKVVVDSGFSAVFDEWRNMSVTIGQHVEVIGSNERYMGIAIDINQDGALIVQTENSVETVVAGDVSIRPQQNREDTI